MIGDKIEHFEGKGKDPSAVQSHIEEYLKSDGFTVQTSSPSEQASGQRTDPDDTDVLQPGRTAAAFQDSESNQMMLVDR